MSKLDSLINKTLSNIEDDRATANKLLTDLVLYMAKAGDTAHASHGEIAAKYLETLQRSNEQIVKILSIVQRDEVGTKGLSMKDKDGLFDAIKER